METIDVTLNGYTDVPAGKVANIATFLEVTEKPTQRECGASDLAIEHMVKPELERYRKLFRAVGEDWLWFSRLTIGEEKLLSLISNPNTDVFFLTQKNNDIGLLELDVKDTNNIELAFFGLVGGVVGRGIGGYLMNHAMDRVFGHYDASRFFVHTCTMDHPGALTFYMKCGFKPYKRAIEIADDPRLSGHIDRSLGKHHPVID